MYLFGPTSGSYSGRQCCASSMSSLPARSLHRRPPARLAVGAVTDGGRGKYEEETLALPEAPAHTGQSWVVDTPTLPGPQEDG